MSYYYDIFADKKDFNINDFKKHMLTNDFMKTLTKQEETVNIEEKQQEVIEENVDHYFPKQKDPLFWCMYIAQHGIEEFNQITRGFANIIINEKQKIGNFYAENPKQMKAIYVKLTNKDVQEIMADFMTNKDVDIKMLYAYSIYYKKRILITKSDFYIDIKPHDCEGKPIVLIKDKKEYGIHENPNIDEILNEYFKLEGAEKPLKSISNYTITELKELANYFDIKLEKKTTKQEIYMKLNKICEW